MQPPIIFITGKAKHGKSEARKILCDLLGCPGASCSDVIYSELAFRQKVPVEDLLKQPKEELRPKLIELGNWLCGDDRLELVPQAETDVQLYRVPSALIRTLYFNGYKVIDGVRRRLELKHACSHLEWCGVRTLVLWIARPGAPDVQDNLELTEKHADVVVENSGTLDELKAKLLQVLKENFPPTAG